MLFLIIFVKFYSKNALTSRIMLYYLIKRILLIFPTLFFIMLINFAIIQLAPGGPVEQFINNMKTHNSSAEISSSTLNNIEQSFIENSADLSAVDQEIIAKIKAEYGFDQPFWTRFFSMLKKFIIFDFGESFYQDKKVSSLIIEKLPVSISLGLFTTLLIYFISIPLGIKKALNDGSKFDVVTSFLVSIGHAIPSFLFAILLIILFASGNFLKIFPIRGLVSDNFAELSFFAKILDYFHHLVLPIIAMVIGGFASLTFFVKNSFSEEINKQYVLTAYAKGLDDKKILYHHIFRNAMMLIIAGIPSAFIAILFTGAMLIEIIFSLDGLGLMGYKAAISRDYPVMFATLYFFTFLGLIVNIISDITYKLVDPRINFDKQT